MKNNKEALNKFKSVFLTKADEMLDKYPDRHFSSWEIISKVLSESSGYDVYYITLEADLDIIKLIAEGLSAQSIANRLSIASLHVYLVANTWGLDVFDSTLDFNPMYVYHSGMSARELEISMNDILPMPITIHEAKTIINNIERYYDLLKVLEEYDNEKG